MIEIPVHNQEGKQVDTLQVEESLLGGEIRHTLLKQAYVRIHANQRIGAAANKSRGMTSFSTRKLYKQKGTGNARRGSAGTNVMRSGGVAFAKRPKSWRQALPKKMRRLANRNALLAKAIDNEIKLVEGFGADSVSTKGFKQLMNALNINRTCLVATENVNSPEAKSARNIEHVDVTLVDRLNVFDVLNHRFLLADKATFEAYLGRVSERLNGKESN